jgi:hypothetical protein
VPGGGDPAGGVEEDRVALRPVHDPVEDRADLGRVLLRAASGQVGRVGRLEPELGRVDHALVNRRIDDLADLVRAARRELVDAGEPVDDERPPRPQPGERVGDRADEPGGVDPEDAGAGAGRVRQRPEDVEDRPGAELTPHGRCMPHRRVMGGGEHEPEPEAVD